MHRRTLFAVLALVLTMLLVACGGGDSESTEAGGGEQVAGDPERGEELYTMQQINGAPGCITCHSLEPDVTLVGPSHADVGARAGDIVPGQSAEAYLRESIVDPDAHVTEGFSPGVMYQNYEQDLTEQQIDDLVAFLLTLQ
jgi:cytochrome c551/c552